MTVDVRTLLAERPMTRSQIVAVSVLVGLNALDGLDILAITFAAPSIIRAWNIDAATMGVVISMSLLGMGLGSVFLAPLADRFGRRPLVLGSLCAMSLGMLLAAFSTNVVELAACRFFTGLGIGSIVAALSALANEHANERRRDLAIGLMSAGYPIGGFLGGSLAAWILFHHDWRWIFISGSVMTLAFIPIVYWRLPESVHFLIIRGGPKALERVNHSLRRLGHSAISALPIASGASRSHSLARLLGGDLSSTLVLLAVANLMVLVTVYYLLGWMPQLVVKEGFSTSDAALVSAYANIGGIAAAMILGWLSPIVGLRLLAVGTMVATGAATAIFSVLPADIDAWTVGATATGFCLYGSIVMMYAMMVRSFPAEVRASGVGLVVGVGRAGAVLAPIMGGLLFDAGVSTPVTSAIFGVGAIVAAVVLSLMNGDATRSLGDCAFPDEPKRA